MKKRVPTVEDFVNEGGRDSDVDKEKAIKEVEKHLDLTKKYIKELKSSDSSLSYIGLNEIARPLHTVWDRLSDANREANQYKKKFQI